MPGDYIPSKDAALVPYCGNVSSRIGSDPPAYALTIAQTDEYAALYDNYVSALNTATSPATRSPVSILSKNLAKKSLISQTRILAAIIQASPLVSEEQKRGLGLTVRSDEPTPIPAPATAPVLEVMAVVGRTVKARMHDALSPTRRGKPAGVAGAALFSYVGPTPPADSDEWHFEGNFTRPTLEVAFPDEVPAGSQVWFTAFWYNPRAQRGPGCAAVGTVLAGGAAIAA